MSNRRTNMDDDIENLRCGEEMEGVTKLSPEDQM